MKRPNKLAIARAIYVTSSGYPSRYFLVVKNDVAAACDFAHLHGVEILSLASANALVRTMRERVESTWRAWYAQHKAAVRRAGGAA